MEVLREWVQHCLLHPRVWQTYRQGRQLEHDLKQTDDIWDVQEKWVANEDFAYYLGIGFSAQAYKKKSKGVLLASLALLFVVIGYVGIHLFALDIIKTHGSFSIKWYHEDLAIFFVAVFNGVVLFLLAFGRPLGILLLVCIVGCYLAWLPLIYTLNFLDLIPRVGLPSLALGSGSIIWTIINSASFAELMSNAGKKRVLRMISKDNTIARGKQARKTRDNRSARKSAREGRRLKT